MKKNSVNASPVIRRTGRRYLILPILPYNSKTPGALAQPVSAEALGGVAVAWTRLPTLARAR